MSDPDEFPNEHPHDAIDLGEGKHGVFVHDEDERHYHLEHTVTAEGVVVDIYDRFGEQLLFTDAETWQEMYARVERADTAPTPDTCTQVLHDHYVEQVRRAAIRRHQALTGQTVAGEEHGRRRNNKVDEEMRSVHIQCAIALLKVLVELRQVEVTGQAVDYVHEDVNRTALANGWWSK